MAHDRRITMVIDRTSPQQRLVRAEPRLDHPQPLVLEGHLGGIQLGVRPQHPLAVVAGILGDLGLVDPEASRPGLAHVPPIALVADQRLVPLPQLLPQRSHDRLSIGRVLAGLVLVATDDVPPALDVDLLDIQG